jgi:hypothetical protein
MADEEPVCNSCGSKCKLVRPIARSLAEHQERLTASIVNRDFASIAFLAPPRNDTDPQLSLRLLSCPRCGQTHTVTVNHISWITSQSGRKMVIRPLVNHLLVTSDEATQLKQIIKRIVDEQAATENSPEVDSPSTIEVTAIAEEAAPGRSASSEE